MTPRKYISSSFFALILSTSALQATTIFGADDELDRMLERGNQSNTMSIPQLRRILSQESFPFTTASLHPKGATSRSRTLRTTPKTKKARTLEDKASDCSSEECVIIVPAKKIEKKQKEDTAPNRLIFELDEEGEVIGNRALFEQESSKNKRLEQIRQDYNEWGKNMMRNLKLPKLQRQYPNDDLNIYPAHAINHLLKDIPVSESEIVEAAKKSPFMQKMLDKGMSKAEVNEMRKRDMVPFYDGKDLEFFGGNS